jgi:Flp pilus assembly protein TadD
MRVALIAGSSLVVLAVAAYFAMPKSRGGSAAKAPGGTTQLPPRVAQKPAATPSTTEAAFVTQAAVTDTAPTAVLADAGFRPDVKASSPGGANAVTRPVAQRPKATDTAGTRSIVAVNRESTHDGARITPVRRDYEAQATALFNAGDWEGARAQFQLAVKYAPNARAWTNYGVTLQRLHDIAGARAAYQAAVGLDATYLEAWLFNARIAMERREPQIAVPLLLRARTINPRHSGVNADLAQLESEALNWTESRRYAEEAIRSDPGNGRAHYYLAIAADQLKDADVALREYAAYLQFAGGPENARTAGYARERIELLRKKP